MAVDLNAAEHFVHANARLLDRHRLAVLLHDGPAAPVLAALRAYRNPDGGFGHALEPDVRGPGSEPVAAQAALGVLAEIDALDDPMVAGIAEWIAAIAAPDGGVPFVTAAAAAHPHGPWMVPSDGGSQVTFALAGMLWLAGVEGPWLARATEWCWREIEGADELGAYRLKFALEFLDRVPDEERAAAAIERLRDRVRSDGTVPVSGGTAGEHLTALDLAERPGLRSRALVTESQVDADLDRLEGAQEEDGGWTVQYLQWAPGPALEWRGAITIWALRTLAANRRL